MDPNIEKIRLKSQNQEQNIRKFPNTNTENFKRFTNKLPDSKNIILENYDTLMVIGAFSVVAFYLILILLSSTENRRNTRRNNPRIGERGQLIRRVNQEIRQRGENGVITDPNIIDDQPRNMRHEFNERMPNIARMRADPNQDQQVTDRLIDIDQERRRRLARRNIGLLRREIKKAVKKRTVRQRIGEEILAMETEDEEWENQMKSSTKNSDDKHSSKVKED